MIAVRVASIGDAIDYLSRAREQGLHGIYFPRGGDTAVFYQPVTHHLVLWGDGAESFRKEILNHERI